MAEITRYVVLGLATGAGDGTSEADAWDGMASAAAGLATEFSSDFVANDVNVTLVCSNPNDLDDACDTVNFSFTVDATRGLRFTNPNPAQLYKVVHNTNFTDRLLGMPSSDSPNAITFNRGFYFKRDFNSGNRVIISCRTGAHFDGCIFECGTLFNAPTRAAAIHDDLGSSSPTKVTNCVFIGSFTAGIHLSDYTNETQNVSANNTFIGCDRGIYCQYANIKSRNDIFQNCTNDFVDDNGGSDFDYMLTDAVSATGANSVANTTLTFADSANGDYSLSASDTAAVGSGIGPSADADIPTTDYLGNARSGTTTDMGAYVYAVVSVTPTITDIDGDNNVQVGQTGAIITTTGIDAASVTQSVTLGGETLPINSWS